MKKRQTGLIEVFDEFQINTDALDIESVKTAYLDQHIGHIQKWQGPVFQHLQLRTKDKKLTDCLSVVYDRKGYDKRCNNSQEDWYRKYDGKFLAYCINEAAQSFGTMALKAQFGLNLLMKKIKFIKSKETYLIPNTWIFGNSYSSLLIALTDLLDIDKTPFKGSAGKPQKRKRLLQIFKDNVNEEVEMKDNNDIGSGRSLQIPPNLPKVTIPNISTTPNTSTPNTSTPYTSTSSSDQHSLPMSVDNNLQYMQSERVNVQFQDEYYNSEEFKDAEYHQNIPQIPSLVQQSSAPIIRHSPLPYMNNNGIDNNNQLYRYTSEAIAEYQKMMQLEQENERLRQQLEAMRQQFIQRARSQAHAQNQQHQTVNYVQNHHENNNINGSLQIQHQQMVHYDVNNGGMNNGNVSTYNQYEQNMNNHQNVMRSINGHYIQQNHSNQVIYPQQPHHMANYNANDYHMNNGNVTIDNHQYQHYMNNHDVVMSSSQNMSLFQPPNQNNSQQE